MKLKQLFRDIRTLRQLVRHNEPTAKRIAFYFSYYNADFYDLFDERPRYCYQTAARLYKDGIINTGEFDEFRSFIINAFMLKRRYRMLFELFKAINN